MSDPKTPANRKAEARGVFLAIISRWSRSGGTGADADELEAGFDAHARACIDEAVAPAVEYLDAELLTTLPEAQLRLKWLRRLLTERAGT